MKSRLNRHSVVEVICVHHPVSFMRATDGSTYRIAVTVALDMYMSLIFSEACAYILEPHMLENCRNQF